MANDNQRGNYLDYDENGRRIGGYFPWNPTPTASQNPRVVNPTPAVRPAVQPSSPGASNPRVVNPTPPPGSSGPGGAVQTPSPGNGYNGYYQGSFYQNGSPIDNTPRRMIEPWIADPSIPPPVSRGDQRPQYSWNPQQWGGFGGYGMGMFNPLSMFGGMGGGYSSMPNVGGFFGGSGLMSMLMNLMTSMPTSMMFPPTTTSYGPAGPLGFYGSGASGGGAYQPNYGGYSGLMSMFM